MASYAADGHVVTVFKSKVSVIIELSILRCLHPIILKSPKRRYINISSGEILGSIYR